MRVRLPANYVRGGVVLIWLVFLLLFFKTDVVFAEGKDCTISFYTQNVNKWDDLQADLKNVYKTINTTIGSKVVLPEEPTLEGYTFIGWKAITLDDDDGYSSSSEYLLSSSSFTAVGDKAFLANFGKITDESCPYSITLNVYSSKEAYENNDSPEVILNNDDCIVYDNGWGDINYAFKIPDISIPDGYNVTAWKYSSAGSIYKYDMNWSYFYISRDIEYNVYPILREVKDSYTVTFYDALYSSNPKFLYTETVNHGDVVKVPDASYLSESDAYCVSYFYVYDSEDKSDRITYYDPSEESYTVTTDLWIDIQYKIKPDVFVLYYTMTAHGFVSIPDKNNLFATYTYSGDSDGFDFEGNTLVKLDAPDTIPEKEGYTFVEYKLLMNEATPPVYVKEGDTFRRYTGGTIDVNNLYVDINSYSRRLNIYSSFSKDSCLVTINDAYYDTDGNTLIDSKERIKEQIAGGSSYTYSGLDKAGYTCVGYRVNTSTYIYRQNTISGTLTDDLTRTFVYVKDESAQTGGRIDIPVEIEADGTTKTDFVADNTILGGDLIVSIPAEMILTYDSDSDAMLKADYVSANGRCASTSELEVKTLTSISYANDDDNTIVVSGTVTFGVDSDPYQITMWSAAELLEGVKDSGNVVKKSITASVLKDDIEYIGTYSTSILYNISVLDNAENETL